MGGFGYDPLFYLPELGKTMAEIDLETKLSISHRGRAIAALLPMLVAVDLPPRFSSKTLKRGAPP